MNNPLSKNNLYATPKNPEEFADWIQGFTGQERVIAMTAASMAWNLASDLVDNEIHTAKFIEETN